MQSSHQFILGVLLLAAIPAAFYFYYRALAQLRREGGAVSTEWVSNPDVIFSLVVGGALAGLAISGLIVAANGEPKPMNTDHLIPGMVFLLVLGGGAALFLAMRNLPLVWLFGLRKVPSWHVLLRAVALLGAAVPLILVFNVATYYLLEGQAEQQELVKLFSDVVRNSDYRTVGLISLAGVVVAPICEELLFRGYFYPVSKRFFGAAPGALLTSLLFAASHVNLASLPGLLALALCFTIAYERTGSILVPISMHALFNGANLLLLYLTAQPVLENV